MKRFVFLLASFAISNSVIAAQFECENSGRITYQDEACNAAPIECAIDNQNPPDTIELFDKVLVGSLRTTLGKIYKDTTELLQEVDAINNSKNRVKLTLKYDGLDKAGFVIDTESLYGTLESYSKIKIKSSSLWAMKKTAILNNIVQWRFNSWSAEINK